MNIHIRYRQHIDLVYHVLSHLHVGNASDCFEQAYIDRIQAEKRGSGIDLQDELKSLAPYYNENFDRAMLLSFLPFYCESLDELKALYLTHERFTAGDREQLIKPLVTLIEKESGFYYDYWQKKYDQLSVQRQATETYLRNKLKNYARLFDYFEKDALVFLSFSIRKNGRGFYQNEAFGAMAPFPETESVYDNAFFTVLHECTHQFTDRLLKQDIHMSDGSHDQSENIVMLADYYIVKAFDPASVQNYLKWVTNTDATEAAFLAKFWIKGNLAAELGSLLSPVLGKAAALS